MGDENKAVNNNSISEINYLTHKWWIKWSRIEHRLVEWKQKQVHKAVKIIHPPQTQENAQTKTEVW